MNGNGKIIARVTLASESVPVKDAIVTASTNVDDKQILLGTRKTDENG